ncbi:MAG: carbohydrate ABC transporter permease [Candidatus Atribacteria bacterium]|nr:carbohydrate ABC transporter permease [Candidatus Atribacteria bacterium]
MTIKILRRVVGALPTYLLMLVVTAIFLVPFLWILSTAFKAGMTQLYTVPPEFIPRPATLENFARINSIMPFWRYTFNTAFVSVVTVGLQLAVCAPAAYALGRIRFKGRTLMFYTFLATMMIPFNAILISLFILCKRLNLTDNFAGVILPWAVDAFTIFLLRQSFASIPKDLEDAARIDGCGHWRIFWSIMLPLVKPSLATAAILTFTWQWNDFLWPLVVLRSKNLWTLQVGVAAISGLRGESWQQISATSVMAMLPLMIIFLVLQRYFISGALSGAVKG